MLRQQLYHDLHNMIAEVKKLDLSKSAKNEIIRALKKMDMLQMFREHKENSNMDFQIFRYLKNHCKSAFNDIDEEGITYYLHEIVYNAIPELEEIV